MPRAVSPLNLVQEQQLDKPHEAWRILVVCALLNRTHGRQVRPMIDRLFGEFPNPSDLCNPTPGQVESLTEMLRPLGFVNKRVRTLVELSTWYAGVVQHNGPEWYQDMPNGKWAMQAPGCGKYAVDSLNVVLYDVYEGDLSDTWLKNFAEWRKSQ